MADPKLKFIIEAATDKAGDALSSFSSGLDKIKSSVFSLKGLLATIGFSISAKEAIEAFSDQQKAIAQTEAVIKSTGGSAGITRDQILSMNKSLFDQTGIADEVILAGQNMLLTFQNLKSDNFDRATRALVDMNTALTGGEVTADSLRSQAIQLGKALNNPIEGVTALKRVGVDLNSGQEETIKKMVELGDVSGAQTIILQELEKEFGNSAAALKDTLSGQLLTTKNLFGEVAEAAGGVLAPVLQSILVPALQETLIKITNFFDDKRVQDWAIKFGTSVLAVKTSILDIKNAFTNIANANTIFGNNMEIGFLKITAKAKEIFGASAKDQRDQIEKLTGENLRLYSESTRNKADLEKNFLADLIKLNEMVKHSNESVSKNLTDLTKETEETIKSGWIPNLAVSFETLSKLARDPIKEIEENIKDLAGNVQPDLNILGVNFSKIFEGIAQSAHDNFKGILETIDQVISGGDFEKRARAYEKTRERELKRLAERTTLSEQEVAEKKLQIEQNFQDNLEQVREDALEESKLSFTDILNPGAAAARTQLALGQARTIESIQGRTSGNVGISKQELQTAIQNEEKRKELEKIDAARLEKIKILEREKRELDNEIENQKLFGEKSGSLLREQVQSLRDIQAAGITININAGAFTGTPEDAKKFAKMIDEQLYNLKRTKQSLSLAK